MSKGPIKQNVLDTNQFKYMYWVPKKPHFNETAFLSTLSMCSG